MKRTTLLLCLIAGSVSAAVEATASKSVLAASAELAPFGDITKKVTALGAMINNPIVPALLIGSGQQKIAETYGRFRSDAPMYWQVYIQTPAFDIASTNDALTELGDLCETVLVYPSAEGSARMALSHPGSTKEADGTLHLLASESNPDERWVKFSADGQYCAFAKSAALANLAIDDFVKTAEARKARAGKDRPILRMDVTERGCSAVEALQKKMDKMACGTSAFDRYRAATFKFDLDSEGFSAEAVFTPRPSVQPRTPACHALPAGVFDRVPANAPLFFFIGNQLQAAYDSEATFRSELVAVGDCVRTNLVVEAKKHKDGQKYGKLLDELAAAFSDLMHEIPYPSATDWVSAALAFDGQRHPYLDEQGDVAKAKEANEVGMKFYDRVIAAVDRQFPGKRLIEKLPDGIVVDWAAVIAVAAAEAGLKADGKEAREIGNAQKTVETVLGGTKTELRGTINGTTFHQRIAAVGVKPAAGKPNGEARVAAALPEIASQRPDAVFYFSIYDFVRELVLPTMANCAAKKDAEQYKAMISAMAPSEPNSALAGAVWTQKDGSSRTFVRLTANELKNFGSAFNAFTAASMSSALGDDEDDDK